jgi:ubiquinone/menaquinone biosynthesis C-methylase UbiE
VAGEWDPEAENWLQWARTPGFDAYWHYRDAFFDSILPPGGGRRTLEVGCGEGRVTRDLVARGHQVIALDAVGGLVRHARDADDSSSYLVADGAHLPVRSGCFDMVVAYNALQVVADMRGTVRECARVLRHGGLLGLCVAHPVTDMGEWSDDTEPPPRLTVRFPYFENTRVEETVERDGLHMTFRGWTYTLEDYALALGDAGFTIEAIREPTPTSDSRYQRWKVLPLFMNVRAVKR